MLHHRRMKLWKVAEPIRGEYCHGVLGTIRYAFDAGRVTPKNEGEEFVLTQVLEPAGLAQAVEPKSSKEE